MIHAENVKIFLHDIKQPIVNSSVESEMVLLDREVLGLSPVTTEPLIYTVEEEPIKRKKKKKKRRSPVRKEPDSDRDSCPLESKAKKVRVFMVLCSTYSGLPP